jgi:poly(A) polymerase
LLLLSRADVTSRRADRRQAADRRVNELQARCEALQAQADVALLTSPLDGHELMTMFDRPPGPWIKPIKDHLTELVIEGELAMDDKERAAEIAREMLICTPTSPES